MKQALFLVLGLSLIANSVSASSLQGDRWYAQVSKCSDGSNMDQKLPCFSCMTFKSEDKANSTSNNNGSNPAQPQSVFTHCGDFMSPVYRIYYLEPDCKGQVYMEDKVENDCPVCWGCSQENDCGKAPGCDRRCCGAMPECARCNDSQYCNQNKDECEGCPNCNTPPKDCNLCTDESACAIIGQNCTGCSGCANPNPHCSECHDATECSLKGNLCLNCPNCSNQADPCKYCVDQNKCTGPNKDTICNFGMCPICSSGGSVGGNNSTGNFTGGNNNGGSIGGNNPGGSSGGNITCHANCTVAACNLVECSTCLICKKRLRSLDELNIAEDFYLSLDDRDLGTGSTQNPTNMTSKSMTGLYARDTNSQLLYGNLYLGSQCRPDKSVGGGLIESGDCSELPPGVDAGAPVVTVECQLSGNVYISKVLGFATKSDCQAKINPTFAKSGVDGSCLVAPSERWAVAANCSGWGISPPLPPPPSLPQPGDIGIAVRRRYPDRRCLPNTGHQNYGDLRPCGVCVAENKDAFQKVNCNGKTTKLFSEYGCIGTFVEVPFRGCDGPGPMRGIFRDEVEFGPKNSYAFFSVYEGDCFTDKVKFVAGLRAGKCNPILTPDKKEMFVFVDCDTRNITLFNTRDCKGAPVFSHLFNDNQCKELGAFPGRFMASCDGYVLPPQRPPTARPTNSPTTPTALPTVSPSKQGETQHPTTSPVNPTGAPTKTSNPTFAPSYQPTDAPTYSPTAPSNKPTNAPTFPTYAPTVPTQIPTAPSKKNTEAPTQPTFSPTEIQSTPKPTEKPSENPSEKPTETPTETPTEKPSENATNKPTTTDAPHEGGATPTSRPTASQMTAAPTVTDNNSTTNATPSPTKRSCNSIPRGCSQYKSTECKAKSAVWTVEGNKYECKCVSTDKSSKVTFKLKVSATTVANFNNDECNVVDLFNGVHKKVYEKTKTSIVNDFPVEVETEPVQTNSDIVVEFAILGFVDSSLADNVIAYIQTNQAAFIAAIEQAGSAALGGAGVDVSLVAGSVTRVDGVAYCGCDTLIDSTGSDASSTFASSSNLIQAITASMVAIAIGM